ncbi:hypothetical protein [Maribacter thermophilus]|uniref:hypothetical protein n=1 Tax=Maribacter thermophilus TaxID=1197874 RepID=UPI0006416BC6|nr:hypothetical protein [Maribacter thermophilus]
MERIHSSQYYTFFQSKTEKCFYIDFGQKVVGFRFCELLSLRQKIWAINIETHFDGANIHGFEILSLCNKEHFFILNTLEVLDLKDLLSGAFYILGIGTQDSVLATKA